VGSVLIDISMSLDGFVAGPNPSVDQPLGEGGERIHEWIVGLESWRKQHRKEGGARNVDSEIVAETTERHGAVIMGRGMFGGGPGPWGDEPWEGWWGDDPPFRKPVFVLTRHAREPLEKQGGTTFTFVTDGVESALQQARTAAGDRDVLVAGGADVAQQYLRAGLVDELQIHVAPILRRCRPRARASKDPGRRLPRGRSLLVRSGIEVKQPAYAADTHT
jgi:dihydrofolate reductase